MRRVSLVVALCLVIVPAFSAGRLESQTVRQEAPRARGTAPADAARLAARQRFLEMFARAYFPGRNGQLLIVPREGDFITRPDPDVAYMHGSPWAYDVSIPLMFAGPAVRTGVYSMPAVQQDVAPTLAAALGVTMPPTATGHVLPVLRPGFARPRVVFLLVLDGMRRDYFDRYADVMPTLSALRRRAAWFSQAHVNYLPTNTAVGHSTIATGTDPRIHGVTVNNIYDRLHRRRQDAVRRDDAAGSDGVDPCRRMAARHVRPCDRPGAGQHRPGGDAARRPWRVSAEWRAGRARQLR